MMTSEVVTVTPTTPLKEVAALLVERDISGVPVVEERGNVLGVVSESDILYKERGPEEESGGFLRYLFRRGDADLQAKLAARTAGEAMSSPPVTVRPSTPISSAAALMLERGVGRLVVVTGFHTDEEVEAGELVGIVTRGDFLRAFARPDHEILRDIQDLIHHEFWIPPEHVSVTIDQGEVTLRGELDTKANAEALARAVAAIPGVVSTDADLRWRYQEEPALLGSRERVL